ncbi:uncharacterized protein PRCAT00002787001 [Priceomyces carsonii]|uniref:uncharacterized protein n=1 Tax=Priceomyces carsonii TaxID=28549 RepID=UPI002ED87455|nr:unnamed protein product [Priceomyces carsonii]
MSQTLQGSQTSKFVKKLASNDRPTREAAFKSLKKYLSAKSSSQLSLLELQKLWKGLYYAMWFCDRPGPQQRLAESLGELFSSVISIELHARFLEAFWVIIINEWPHIDQWRIDKYYLLIRRVLRHNFIQLKSRGWDDRYVNEFLKTLEKLPLSGEKSVSVALPYHLCDIYIDEMELVLFNELSEETEENEDNEEDGKNVSQKKREILDETPISLLISPFISLSKKALLKTLREKCKEDVIKDKRLKEWGILGDEDGSSDLQGERNEEHNEGEESDEEWTGFS